MRVLVTGCSGYLGSMAVRILAEHGGWEIFGLDLKLPEDEKLLSGFVEGSVAEPVIMRRAFEMARPDVAVHLAFVVDATHNPEMEETVAVVGSKNFLESCAAFGVRMIVFMSSVAAYGAHEDNDLPLTESSPIRGVEGYSYSWLKAKADLAAQGFMREHPECEFTILRPCLFIGPHTCNHFFDRLKFPIVPRVCDSKGVRDPLFQFIHEDDMAGCLVAAIEKPVRGVFNIAAEGQARFSELVRKTGKRSLPIPAFLLYPATWLLWKIRIVASPPAQLDFIRYPWIMDVSRMRNELYLPAKTSEEAFSAFIHP
jgi:UDP-glucose 4-epimerase